MEAIFEKSDYLLSCDWGTSSFRLSLVERHSSQIVNQISTDGGIKPLFTRWSQGGNPGSRESNFLNYLKIQIQDLENKVSLSLEETPVAISGMASSSIGITELPYASVPLSLQNPALPSRLISSSKEFPNDILLLSGIQATDDIMRGEEIQLIGLAVHHQLEKEKGICIMPGTHCKHAFIEQHRVVNFKTYMTGELFELLATQSILADSVAASEQPLHTDTFREGCELAQKNDLLHSAFKVRINDLLLDLDSQSNYDLLSGLIIGTELAALSNFSNRDIFIIGSGPLISRYDIALRYLGFNPTSVTNTDELVMQGHLKIIQQNN